jgi:hypothetical protein
MGHGRSCQQREMTRNLTLNLGIANIGSITLDSEDRKIEITHAVVKKTNKVPLIY